MVKPVILTVDDEPVVLKAVDRDLQTRYQRDYQIIEEGSGREALETVLKHKQRNTAIALFLADCARGREFAYFQGYQTDGRMR